MEEINKKVIRTEFLEIGEKGNLAFIPRIFTENFVRHFLPNRSQINGLIELRDNLALYRKAFPDWAEKIEMMVAEEDSVAVWYSSSGTNTGDLPGRNHTGNRISINNMSIFRMADGMVAEQWLLPDLMSLSSQLGFIPVMEMDDPGSDNMTRFQEMAASGKSSRKQKAKQLAFRANKEVWNRGNFEYLNEMFSEDFVQHFLPLGTRTTGLEEFRRSSIAHRDAFPDWTEVINLAVSENDYVALLYKSTGTNTGSFLNNPPTGKKIQISEMTIFRVVDDRIVEQWLLPDIHSLNLQLGLTKLE